MKMGIQAWPTPEDLVQIRERRFSVVRIDCQNTDDPMALIQPVLDAGLEPLAIIKRPEMLDRINEQLYVEFGNEACINLDNHWPGGLPEYREAAEAAVTLSRGRHRLFVGAVANLEPRDFRWLRGLPWASWPSWVGCAIHRYPGAGFAQGKQKPFEDWIGEPWTPRRYTRDGELDALKALCGERPYALTETGYARSGYTPADQAQNMAMERELFEKHGFEIAVGYQLRSEPDEMNGAESYGFRKNDGVAWWPQTEAWTWTN